jgi:hypothetical protein
VPDKQVWKQRFILFTAARIFGILTLIAGLAISFSDVLRPGGWPLVGGIVMVAGLIDAVVAPILLRKYWAEQDKQG